MATGLPWRDAPSDPLLMFQTDALGFLYCGIVRVLYTSGYVCLTRLTSCECFLLFFGLSFHFLEVSFEAQKLFFLMQSNTCMFSLVICACVLIPKVPGPGLAGGTAG